MLFYREQIILVSIKYEGVELAMEQRFIRNIPTITEAEQCALRTKSAVIVGCGGLGGYIAEFLARAGVGKLTLVDGDSFEESNLNRQLYALPENMGESKARCAAQRLRAIDSAIELRCFEEFFKSENAEAILAEADIVMDALDSIPTRLLLEDECSGRGLCLVHGAVEGWGLQVCVSAPGSNMLHRLYGDISPGGGKSVLSPVVAACAGLQCVEAIKILCGRPPELEGKLLVGDLQSMEFMKVEF